MKKEKNKKNEVESVKILAFGPHPDDVEFGCSGALVKASKKGFKTAIVDMSEAELSTNGNVESRYIEAEKARKIMGVTYRENLRIPNNEFYNNKEIQKRIVDIIRKYRPEIILIPYNYDRHPDHENASRLIREAVFSAGLIKFKTDNEYEKHRPVKFYYYAIWEKFEPDVILDISEEFEKKLEALAAYDSQMNLSKDAIKTIDNDGRMEDYVKARSVINGFEISTKYGESYKNVYNYVGITDFDNLTDNLF